MMIMIPMIIILLPIIYLHSGQQIKSIDVSVKFKILSRPTDYTT